MREIKFRGKRVDNGKFIYGDLIQWKSKNKCSILPQEGSEWSNPYDFEVIPETVGQFIGLTDKNGKEIYEGSELKSYHFNDGKKDHYLYHTLVWSDKFNGWQCVSKGQNGNEPNGNPQLFVYLKSTARDDYGFEVV